MMGNVIPDYAQVIAKFDIKGSKVDRKSDLPVNKFFTFSRNQVYKDLDFERVFGNI